MMTIKKHSNLMYVITAVLSLWVSLCLGAGFSYQGRLNNYGDPAEGGYDFQVRLFDSETEGEQLGNEILVENVSVSGGYFKLVMDFGDVFNGEDRWLEIAVRPYGEPGQPDFVPLLPRQVITPAPYAIYSSEGAGLSVPAVLIAEDAEPVVWVQNDGPGAGLFSSSVESSGVEGRSATTNGLYGAGKRGVYGEHPGSGNYGYLGDAYYGVYGRHASGNWAAIGTEDAAIWAQAESFEGNVSGVYGISPNYYGVRGSSASSNGVYGSGKHGVYGEHITSGNYGYLGSDGAGAYGRYKNGNIGTLGEERAGVSGESSLDDGVGVFGSSANGYGIQGSSAFKYGVYGTGPKGVYGLHPASGHFGYLGSETYGVYGRGTKAVYGESIQNSQIFGILGNTSTAVSGQNLYYGNIGELGTAAEGVLASSVDGNGVYATSEKVYGVYGKSSGNFGVYGESRYGGVCGTTSGSSSSPRGFLGYKKDSFNIGVYGESSSGSSTWGALGVEGNGVVGYAENGETAARFVGKVSVEGDVGIGTWNPSHSLDIQDEGGAFVNVDGQANGLSGYRVGENGEARWIVFFRQWQSDNLIIRDEAGNRDTMTFESKTGRVGIGTSTPRGELDVNGAIYQRGMRLHADYVFEGDYNLESIEDHAEFMWSNKHLPAIPKAQRDENGTEIIEVGSHRRGIVEELEKAHIYIAQLNDKCQELSAQNKQLQEANAMLMKQFEERITELERRLR